MTYWTILVGRGTDGGFGDYSPPYWNDEPLKIDSKTIYFKSEELAQKFAKSLSKASRDAFYEAGNGDSYSGDFPIEYKPFKNVEPELNVDEDNLNNMLALATERGAADWVKSSYDYDYDEEEFDELLD